MAALRIKNFITFSSLFISIKTATIILALSTTAQADSQIIDNHVNTDVDVSAPIKAMATLDSLQNTAKPIDMALPNFQRFTTSQGIPVIFIATNQLPIVDIDVRFKAGSAYDDSIRVDAHGLANMVASQLTKGTKKLTENQYVEAIEQLGIRLSSKATNDHLVVSLRSLSEPNNLEPALKLMQQAISNPRFDNDVLERSKAQQVNRLMQMQQNPDFIANTVFIKALYGNHPYAHNVSGSVSTIPTITQKDLQRFHQRYLVANNASINITGNLSLDSAKKIAETLTKNLPMGQPASPLYTPKKVNAGQHIHIEHDSAQTAIVMGQLGYAVSPDSEITKLHSAFNIGNDVVAGGGFHSRLTKKIRKDLGYTYSIYGSMSPRQVNGPYAIRFSTRNEKSNAAIDATLNALKEALDKGVTQEEISLTKEGLINSYPMRFASNAHINAIIGSINAYDLPDSRVTNYISRVKKAEPETINKMLNTIEPTNFIIVTVGKTGEVKYDEDSIENLQNSTINSDTTHTSFSEIPTTVYPNMQSYLESSY